MNDKEKEELEFQLSLTNPDSEVLENFIYKLQAENAKLRKCIEFYADYKNDNPDNDWNNDYAGQVLKELELK